MIVRVLNLLVIGALVLAAAWVYRIKYDSTVQAEHLAKLRDEVRHERDKIAALRAEWGELDDPARIEALAKRFLKLKPVTATQFDALDRLPDRPPDYLQPGAKDPIGGIIEHLEEEQPLTVTSSVTPPAASSEPPPETPQPPPSAQPPQTVAPPDAASDQPGVSRP